MPKRSSKKRKAVRKKLPQDVNEAATSIVEQATGQANNKLIDKNPAAVVLGRLGGLKGGPARAAKLSAKERSEIARKAANARWKSESS